MKIKFTLDEISYLQVRLEALAALLKKFPTPIGSERVLLKMKHKFSPNAPVVFLGRKERDLLQVILGRLHSEHQKNKSTDVDTIISIYQKVKV